MNTLTQTDIYRYRRQLPLFGLKGQNLLRQARVVCVGAGGLGAPTLIYLARAGIGTLTIVEDDQVSFDNLHRQVLYDESDIGLPKTSLVAKKLKSANSKTIVKTVVARMNLSNAEQLLVDHDVIVDATDNFQSHYLLNDISLKIGIPLVSASLLQFQAQCSVFNYHHGPCYRCLHKEPPPDDLASSCDAAGVLGPIAGMAAMIQATEVCKIVLNQGVTLSGRLLCIDGYQMTFKEYCIKKNKQCPACVKGQPSGLLFKKLDKPNNLVSCALTVHACHELLSQQAAVLLDVREDYERDICKIEPSTHVPLNKLSPRLIADMIKTDKKIVVYCKSGARSIKAVNLIKEEQSDFQDIYYLDGGILSWVEKIDKQQLKY